MSSERFQELDLDPAKISGVLGREACEIAGRPGVFKIDLSDFEEPKALEIEPATRRVDLVTGLSRSSLKNVDDVSVENGKENQTLSVVFLSEQVGKTNRVSRLRIEHVLDPVEKFNCTCEMNFPFEVHFL